MGAHPVHRIRGVAACTEMPLLTPDIPAFRRYCRSRGLDLVHPFDRAWLPDLGDHRLGAFGRDSALGLLVANSRALWDPFVASLGGDELPADPLDDYCVRQVTKAASLLGARFEIHFAHQPTLPIQRIAQAVGFATLSPSHMSLHADHGPWIGLRAVVMVDAPGPGGSPSMGSDPCASCPRPCMQALEEALAPNATWEHWLAVRDRCPEGRASRYGHDQIRYHYTKARRILRLQR